MMGMSCLAAVPQLQTGIDYIGRMRVVEKVPFANVLSVTNSHEAFEATFLRSANDTRDPNQGGQIMTCLATWNESLIVLKIDVEYEHDPVFRPKGTSTYSYDESGNAFIWRIKRRVAVFSNRRNDERISWVIYCVNSSGKILATEKFDEINRYTLGDSRSVYLFEQCIQAVGRGFSPLLDKVLESSTSTTASGGLVGLKALQKNRFTGEPLAEWSLKCSTADGLLVREAAKTFINMSKPILAITSSGRIECPSLVLARSGMFISGAPGEPGTLEVNVVCTNLKEVDLNSKTADNLDDKVKSELIEPLRAGAIKVNDYR
jgi:hypothetical protein